MHLPDPSVRAISLLSNSPNQNDLILVHFLQFHFRSTSDDGGIAIYDDIESTAEKINAAASKFSKGDVK